MQLNDRYYVYSGDREAPVLEVIRTVRRVADEDAALLKAICHKPAWVEERKL
jgi:hypothetical protein